MLIKNQILLIHKILCQIMLLQSNATFRLISIIIIIILFLGNPFPVSATTPVNTQHGIEKDENFVVYTPWGDGVNAIVSTGNLYGGGDHTDNGFNQYYAIDFNLQPNNTHQAIYPAQSGYIVYAHDMGAGLGNTVILRHNFDNEFDYYTLYGHLDNPINVTANSANPLYIVRNSTNILGWEGKTGGTSTGEHLHFAIFKCNKSVSIPAGLFVFNGNCKSVIPEPLIGREVYEGFGLSAFNRQASLFGTNLSNDSPVGPPSSVKWTTTATSNGSIIASGQTIKFRIEGLPSDAKEVRFTAWYNGSNNDGWSTMNGDAFDQNWRILDRSWPVPGQTTMEYIWDPYNDPRSLVAPWLPAGNAINLAYKNSLNSICISFDVFDKAGNVAYAPAGVQCNSAGDSALDIGITSSAAADSARLIYLNPIYSQANDNIPPTGSWNSPSNGQTISSGSVVLNINASDNAGGSGIREVRWGAKYGGQWYGIGTASSSPYSTTWDWCTAGVQNGDVELGFEVWDNANNKWVYSEHAPSGNIHINKNYDCATGGSGSINWSTHFYNGMDHWWDPNNTGNQMCSGSFSQGNLDKNYGDGSPCGGATDNWVGDYKATVNFLPGNYAFWVDHDDWLKLRVDGREIYSVNGVHSEWKCVDNGYLYLSGNHDIWVILAEQGGQARIKVEWSKNNGVCDLPLAFTKSSPLNGLGAQSINPILSWGATGGAKSYSYCIDTTNNNSCDNPNWYNIDSATSVNVNGLNPNTTYYWQVKAYSQGGAGTEASNGAWWSFTTQANPPNTFNKVSPTASSGSQPSNLTLNWGASTGTSWYQYCYDTTNNNICDNDMWYSAGTNTSAYVSDLAESTTYYWQARANNGGGTTYANGNTWWSFTTGSNPPFINSITRLNLNPSNLASVNFAVTFSESVTGVDVADFSLTTTGVIGTSVMSVSGSGATRTIHVNTGSGNGSIRLNVIDNDSILDATSNKLGGIGVGNGNFMTGEVYTVNKTLIFNSVGAHDGWILESTETSNIGGTVYSAGAALNLGDSALKQQYRSILSFTTGILPDTAVITGATLKLRKNGFIGGTNQITVFQGFMVDIKNGFFGTLPALQALDFDAAASKTLGPASPILTGNFYNFGLINGKDYINKLSANGGLTQIRLRFKLDDNDNAVANYLSLYSGNASVAADAPQLIIQYYVP